MSAEDLDGQPGLAEATRVWARIGLLSFGGPAAQIALMHRELVEERNWLSENRFLNALSFCMLLPGPEAMQLATYAGWRMHGTLGGLIAGLLFVLPGAFVMLALSALYVTLGQLPLIESLFLGIKAAVIVIVIEALLRVSRKALNRGDYWVIAGLAFVGIFVFALPYPLIVVAAAAYGFLTARAGDQSSVEDNDLTHHGLWNTMRTICLWLAVWFLPLIALQIFAPGSLLNPIGEFFSKLAVVTFGGAYAVLAYMGQDVVQNSAWLTAGEMMDGLGLAETTPGPLILVTQFVGFLAAFKEGGFWLALAATGVTLWATFAPCFLWIFTGAPYIDWISNQPRLKGALSAITAAVVGVILNLSIWFALHVFFTSVRSWKFGWIQTSAPDLATLDWRVVVLTVVSAIVLFRLHWGIAKLLLAMAGLALVLGQF
ncbi:MAG: chromate efflux transporter [Rhizobiaceae bacterium]|nr:chromate efflux transporter [Rhizobiaceae bacterium]